MQPLYGANIHMSHYRQITYDYHCGNQAHSGIFNRSDFSSFDFKISLSVIIITR